MTTHRARIIAYALAASGGVIYAKQWDQLALVWACLTVLFIIHLVWRPSASRK